MRSPWTALPGKEPALLERIAEVWPELLAALGQTGTMLLVAIPLAVLIGTPLGVLLYALGPDGLAHKPRLHRILDSLVNLVRSFPFLILLIAIIPFTRFVVGTTIGTAAVIVPLTINAIPYFARFVEQNLTALGGGVVEAARSMGATRGQIVRDVLLVEARPALISSITIMTVGLVLFQLFCWLFAPWFTKLLYPTLYDHSLPYIFLANLGAVVNIAGNMAQPMILKACSTKYLMAIQLIYGIAYILLSAILLPLHGLMGFCVATICANLIRLLALYGLGLWKI